MITRIGAALISFLLATFLVVDVIAAPGLINYQGQLTDSSGNPITTATSVTFTFWDAESDGNILYGGLSSPFSDTDSVTPNNNGVFSTMIGDDPGNLIPASIFYNDTVYLAVWIGAEQLSPRQLITSSVYAFNSVTANELRSDLQISFRAYLLGTQSIPDITLTKVLFDTVVHDHGDGFDTTTGEYTIPTDGVYHFDAFVTVITGPNPSYRVSLDVNGGLQAQLHNRSSDAGTSAGGGGVTLELTAGSVVRISVTHYAGAASNVATSFGGTFFSGHRVY